MKGNELTTKMATLSYVLCDDVTTGCYYTYSLLYLTSTVCHFPPLQHRASVRSAELPTLLR